VPGGANPADVAWARMDDTGVVLRDWSLLRTPEGVLRAQVRAADFALDLRFTDTQPLLLQGEQGRSRKGPDAAQFSYYYSRPQLQTQGEISLKGKRKVWLWIVGGLCVFTLAFFPFSPQLLHPAIIPILIAVAIRSFKIARFGV
jgi:hypothetical protein